MNWKQINEKYPKAFLEWAKTTSSLRMDLILGIDQKGGEDWFEIRYTNEIYTSIRTIHGCQIYAMPTHFDTLGIHIDAYFLSSSIEIIREYTGQKIDKPFAVSVHWDMAWDEDETFPDRLSALKAGVEKAFEIREEQLNKI